MNEEKTVGELALPPATAERLEVEALVEAFVGTDGLGNSRLRGLVDSLRGSNESLFPTTLGLGEFGIGELLRLLARQAPSPFARRSPRRASWESLSAIFQRAVQSGDRKSVV